MQPEGGPWCILFISSFVSLLVCRPSVAMSPCLPLSRAPSFCLLRWAGSGTGLLGPQVVEEGQAAPCGVSGYLLGQGSSLRAGTERRKRVPESAVSSHPSQCVRSILVIGIPESGNKQRRELVIEERAQENILKLKGLIVQT